MVFFKDDDEGQSPAGGARDAGGRTLPLLPLRDIVVFPHMVVPLFVGRTRSIAALEQAGAHGRELLLVAQTELGRYIVEGQGTPEDTMNSIAEQHHQILLDAGLIEE